MIDAGCAIGEYVVCDFVQGAVCCCDGGISCCWTYVTVFRGLPREVELLLDNRLIVGNILKGKSSMHDSAHMVVTVDFSRRLLRLPKKIK